jgi:hypothetical protein
MPSSTTQIPKWNFIADYIETCNCDYGCPCRSGSYGDARLDCLDFIAAQYWSKAIHEGNGTTQLFITNKANEEQRQALINIYSGQAKGDAPFELFAQTIKYFLEPQFVNITINLNGKKSSFSVAGVLDVQTEGFANPITGEARQKDTTTKRFSLETCGGSTVKDNAYHNSKPKL